MKINIYTDGAHSSKTNVGGWAIITVPIVDTTTNNKACSLYTYDSGWENDTTNNRMELTAVLRALIFIYKNQHIAQITTTTIYTDSAYISNAFKDRWFDTWRKNGWRTSKKTPVLNQDLWELILYYYELLPDVVITRVAGHAGDKWNELADKLAVEARTIGAKIIQESNINNETKENKS